MSVTKAESDIKGKAEWCQMQRQSSAKGIDRQTEQQSDLCGRGRALSKAEAESERHAKSGRDCR